MRPQLEAADHIKSLDHLTTGRDSFNEAAARSGGSHEMLDDDQDIEQTLQ